MLGRWAPREPRAGVPPRSDIEVEMFLLHSTWCPAGPAQVLIKAAATLHFRKGQNLNEARGRAAQLRVCAM